MSMPLIDMRDIRKQYGRCQVLQALSLQVEKGEFLTITGASGAGKSTLLHILGCLEPPEHGDYYLMGHNVSSMKRGEVARLRMAMLGFVFQSFHLISDMTAWENVELPLIYRGMRPGPRRTRVAEALERLGLAEKGENFPGQLSGGQAQRVAIARALVTRPPILLADEPTGNLDGAATAEVMRTLYGLYEEGVTVLMITHDNRLAQRSPRWLRLMEGKLVEGGDPVC